MKLTRQACSIITALLLVATIAGCSSGEERQAKYFDKAQALYDSGDYEKANLEVRNVLQINPNHSQARYLWALLKERDQNWREMFGNLQMAVDLDPTYTDARIKLGQLYYRSGAFEQAMEQANAVLELEPDNADAHTLRGSVLFRQGDSEGAVAEAQLALTQVPGHIGAISIITEVYKTQDPERALAVIGDGIEQQTQDATLKLLKISVLQEQGDLDGVVQVYKELIAEYPENLFFHYRLVKYYEAQDRIDEAEDLLRDIVKTKPDNLQLKLWLAEFIANQRNLELAEATVKEFIDKQPDIYQLRFALAKIYTALRQYPEAEQVYREVIALDAEGEDSQYARNQLVKLYLARGERAEAETLLAEIFEIEKENTEALITTARLKLVERDTDAAIANLRTVVKNEPTSTEALLLLAQAHEAAGAQDLALDNYRNAMAVSTNNEQAILNAARLLVARDEFEPADELLLGYLKGNPQSADAVRLLVESYSKQDRLEGALDIAESLEQNQASLGLALYLQGRIYVAQKKFPEAQVKFEETLLAEPTAVEALAFLVSTYRAQGKEDEAYKYLVKHLEQYPQQAHAHEQLAALERLRGDNAAAISNYEKALQIQPNRASAILALAQTQMQAGDEQAGFATYQRAMEANPQNANLKVLAAGEYERREMYEQARGLYETALEIDGENLIAKNNLAMILVDHFASEDNLEKALELASVFEGSDQPVFQDTLGWVHYRRGAYALALPFFEMAVKKDPSAAVYQYHLGMTAFRLNEMDKAKDSLRIALQTDPSLKDQAEFAEITSRLGLEE